MNPLAFIAGKLILTKVVDKLADRVHADENVKTIKAGTNVYLKQADKKKSAAWVAVVITVLTVSVSMGWISGDVGQALIELFSNEAVQNGIEGAAESLTD